MQILQNIPLRDKNTYHIGGNCAFYAEPSNDEEIRYAITHAKDNALPVFIIGKGSNVLISDQGWPGLVINLSQTFDKITWEQNRVEVQSGVLLNALVNQVVQHSFAGMEELLGIPGTIGGGIIMNAGAFSMCVSDTLEWVRYYDFEKDVFETHEKGEMAFGYRTSALKDQPVVVLSASFNLTKTKSLDELSATKNTILLKRKEKQPLEFPNCGSVFKRPQGNFAGTLIESCGLKGERIGDAEVSLKHANFIINRGNATAEDVRMLIALIQKRVYESSGVLLEPEVIFIGSFDNQLFVP